MVFATFLRQLKRIDEFQFCYLSSCLGIETVSWLLLLWIARMDVDLK